MTLNKCIECGTENDTISGVDHNHKLKEGDVIVCLRCGHMSIALANGALREPTTDESLTIHQNKFVQRVLAARAWVMKDYKEKTNAISKG